MDLSAIDTKSGHFYLKSGIISLTNLNSGTEIGIISQTERHLSIITLIQSTDRGLLQKMGLNAHFFFIFNYFNIGSGYNDI